MPFIAIIAVSAFFTVIMGMKALLTGTVSITKVPIIMLKNALLGIIEIIQYNAYQCTCVLWTYRETENKKTAEHRRQLSVC